MQLKDFYTEVSTIEDNGEIITEISINKHHEIYIGHFPERPVTPGVILMQLFKEEVEKRTNKNLQLEKALNVKFMAVVDPNLSANFTMYSHISENDGFIELKAMAKHQDKVALKINSTYKIISDR